MKPTNLVTKGLVLAVLATVVFAAQPASVHADEIKLPVDDPIFGGKSVDASPNPGDDPRVIYNRDRGIDGRRDVGLDPGDLRDPIKLPVRNDFGYLGWLWKLRLLLDVTPA